MPEDSPRNNVVKWRRVRRIVASDASLIQFMKPNIMWSGSCDLELATWCQIVTQTLVTGLRSLTMPLSVPGSGAASTNYLHHPTPLSNLETNWPADCDITPIIINIITAAQEQILTSLFGKIGSTQWSWCILGAEKYQSLILIQVKQIVIGVGIKCWEH